ncbi:hypothetical protein [Streptomyces sp. HSG2]|uniref:hypothetical protein n=1 Tax=Streptomyces sp. HSG2 TaxID=2797167 RepID=UPI0019056461|nr:hypothetical protein [Streptomyces sp. HSG2]
MSAVIRGVASAVGIPTVITELPEDAVSPDVARQLVDRGQRLCPVADDEIPLVTESVGASLAASGLAPDEVRHILVTTETMTVSGSRAAHEQARGRLYKACADLGLGHAPVTALTFGGCGAVLSAIDYAALMVERDSTGGILVVAVGRMRDGDSRELAPAVSAIGDGVASCVVTSGGGGWTLRWLLRRAFLETAKFDHSTDFGPTLVTLGRALRSMRNEAKERGLPQQPRLVCNNYGLPTIRLFGSALSIAMDDVFVDNIPMLSHLGTPDLLINLASLPSSSREVLALATGPADCALALLERTSCDTA